MSRRGRSLGLRTGNFYDLLHSIRFLADKPGELGGEVQMPDNPAPEGGKREKPRRGGIGGDGAPGLFR